ncbi:protein-glutamate methylesterase/protein-glutamine glutaminase [Haliovirga abyssi]|uniref:Protein-glutamate methylesterase/protein-glutamine glutaminase n=1 Tax=Haliovirga abyssi TaxID=2996794 RepID=A0AAU9DE96_9FUSO|nr:chemotaxis response regulator protein-glutamate methylesterase [Haliovirga abyssi]BDU49642.1 chemotaxis response regulator protein-glutamate methylesterase [Haliovirga abyssi]
MNEIRVIVADDSALMRRTLKKIIEMDSRLVVIETARDGEDAVNKVKELKPDVVTMDINMPKMDGLTALQIIIEEDICPIVVVSSLSQRGALTTYEALELGAFACVGKPGGTVSTNMADVQKELCDVLYEAALIGHNGEKLKRLSNKMKTIKKIRKEEEVLLNEIEVKVKKGGILKAVALGISTGGPKNIYDVLPLLPKNLNAAIFVVQHMPPNFTESYAKRLNKYCDMEVVEAKNGMLVERGVIYIGKGGYHIRTRKNFNNDLVIRLSRVPKHMFMPSVGIMMESILDSFGENTLGVLMTGMGDDGANGMVKIKQAGGYTIAEAEETCIVFGMPQEAIKRGGADIVLPSYKIAKEIINKVGLYK